MTHYDGLTPDHILDYLRESPAPVTKNELSRAFALKGDERIGLKRLLRDLEAAGEIVKQPGQAYSLPQALPDSAVIEISDISLDGDTYAKVLDWDEARRGPPPKIEVKPDRKGHPPMEIGDRALARLRRISGKFYIATILRRLDTEAGRVLGLVGTTRHGYVLYPAARNVKMDFDIPDAELGAATPGDMVVAELQPGRGLRRKVRVKQILGRQDNPRIISLVASHEMGLRQDFPEDVLAATEGMTVPSLQGREDLRHWPLVTIDGQDARDFDDAVFAERMEGGGFHLIVAIADVAFYVRPGTPLDREAYLRGNSTYFPDLVLPMLPEALSNDLCSLRPHEDRACMAIHMEIDENGALIRKKIVRGLMKSRARLTYEQVQAAHDGIRDDKTADLMTEVITPLYEAYGILLKARKARGALDLDLPERQIVINEKGEMSGVRQRDRYESHKLIEEFMILANVAAAELLEGKHAPCVYRVHDSPSPEKLDMAREFIHGFGLSLPKGNVIQPKMLNDILTKAESHPLRHLINMFILRTQAQAHYSPDNIGHFGLALRRYAHFTSPIRRYADLLVHRALIRAYDLGPGGLDEEQEVRLTEMADHISQTERASAEAERNAIDRFTAAWLSERVGAEFAGKINGATRFGLFVTLDENGADGFVPIRTLPHDYYIHNEKQHALIGERTGRVYRVGAAVTVRLVEADRLLGRTTFEMVGSAGADIPGFELKQQGRTSRGRSFRKREDGRNAQDKNPQPPKKSHRSGRKGRDKNKGKPRGKP